MCDQEEQRYVEGVVVHGTNEQHVPCALTHMYTQDVHADLRGTTVLMRASVPALLLESKEYHFLACQQLATTKGKRVSYKYVCCGGGCLH